MPATAQIPEVKKIGLVAGGGQLPQRLIEACDKKGIEVFVAAFEGQTDPETYRGRHHILTRVGAAGRIINTFHAHEITDLVLVGAMHRPTLTELRPDFRTARFFARIGFRALGDDGILRALREELEREGFRIHGIQEFASELLAGLGTAGRHKPRTTDWPTIDKGLEVVRALGALDVGQAVVMQQGITLGVEGAEGTDALIERCGKIAHKGRGPILIKTSKPGQDLDLDLPTIGPQTIRNCQRAGFSGIVVEAGNSLLMDAEETCALADEAKIFIYGIQDPHKSSAGS